MFFKQKKGRKEGKRVKEKVQHKRKKVGIKEKGRWSQVAEERKKIGGNREGRKKKGRKKIRGKRKESEYEEG